VSVSNVNGCDASYSYEADLVGIDGAANIAVLYINSTRQWNQYNPKLNLCSEEICSHHHHCHPFLNWGKSRSTCPSDEVIVIGNIAGPDFIGLTGNEVNTHLNAGELPPNSQLNESAENGVALATLADNRYVSYGGNTPGELLLLSIFCALGQQTGLPVLNIQGKVIGMTVGNLSSNSGDNNIAITPYQRSVALSEFFMRRPVKALIGAYSQGFIPEKHQGFLQSVADPIGAYYAYSKSWLGLSGIVSIQADYDTTIDLTSGQRIPVLVDGALTFGPACKEIVGYRILAVANESNPNEFFTLGTAPVGTPRLPPLPNSPLVGIIEPGDIVTHINGCPLGDRKGQVSPALVMWRVRPGEVVTLRFKRQFNGLEQECQEISVQTLTYQPFMDYPFYATISNNKFLPTLL
jgi:S1-C subfamily serine protease